MFWQQKVISATLCVQQCCEEMARARMLDVKPQTVWKQRVYFFFIIEIYFQIIFKYKC